MRSSEELQTKVRETVRDRLPLIVLSLVVLIVMSTILSTIVLSPLSGLIMADSTTAEAILASVLSLYLSCAIVIILVFGFSIILGRFYRNEQAVIGYMAWGFRDIKRMSLLSLLVSVVFLAASFIVIIPSSMYLLGGVETGTEEEVLAAFNTFFSALPILILLIIAIMLPVFMPYLFSFPIMFHERDMKLFAVLKKSRALLKGRKWKLFCFAMKCALYPLITCAVCMAGIILLPQESSLGSIASLVFTIALYYCLVYIVLAVIAWYYELANPDTLCIASDPATDASEAAPQETECESLPEEPNQNMW